MTAHSGTSGICPSLAHLLLMGSFGSLVRVLKMEILCLLALSFSSGTCGTMDHSHWLDTWMSSVHWPAQGNSFCLVRCVNLENTSAAASSNHSESSDALARFSTTGAYSPLARFRTDNCFLLTNCPALEISRFLVRPHPLGICGRLAQFGDLGTYAKTVHLSGTGIYRHAGSRVDLGELSTSGALLFCGDLSNVG